MLGDTIKLVYETGVKFLSFEIDFGDVSFTLWQLALGGCALFLVIYLIARILE